MVKYFCDDCGKEISLSDVGTGVSVLQPSTRHDEDLIDYKDIKITITEAKTRCNHCKYRAMVEVIKYWYI
jgi:DNA-directed RNA polymerase subunit RPC12/RpoP